MVDYKIIKYCRTCNKRFVVLKGESKRNYCTDCQARFAKEQNTAAKKKSTNKVEE